MSLHLDAPTIAGWTGPQAATSIWRPTFIGAAGQVKARIERKLVVKWSNCFTRFTPASRVADIRLITYGNDLTIWRRRKFSGSATRRVRDRQWAGHDGQRTVAGRCDWPTVGVVLVLR